MYAISAHANEREARMRDVERYLGGDEESGLKGYGHRQLLGGETYQLLDLSNSAIVEFPEVSALFARPDLGLSALRSARR